MTDETNIDKPKKKRIMSEEHKRKLSEAHKGQTTWNKGIHCSEEQKRKISEAKKGHPVSDETKEKISEANTGKYISEETKLKISEAMKGKTTWIKDKHHTEETKKKISDAKKGRDSWNKGVPRDEETKEKISKANKGKIMSEEQKIKISNANKGKHEFTEEQRQKQSESNEGQIPWIKGKHHTEETKLKMRKSAIKHLEELGLASWPRIGTHETQILDKLESLYGYKIIRQYPVAGYFIDGYIPELNIAIEVDEEHHKNQKEKDIKREDDIKQELGCEFFRIKESKFIKNETETIYNLKQTINNSLYNNKNLVEV